MGFRASARAHGEAVQRVQADQADRQQRAAEQLTQTDQALTNIASTQIIGGFIVAVVALSLVASAIMMGWHAIHFMRSGIDAPQLTYMLLMMAGFCGVAALTIIVVLVLWVRRAKHAQRVRQERRAGGVAPAFVASEQAPESAVAATCSVCGGPMSFESGQDRAQCPFCGATVVPCKGHKQKLLAIALREADRARLIEHRAARQNRRRQMESRRSYAIYVAVWLTVSASCLLPFVVPAIGAILLFRRARWGVEDAIDGFAVSAGTKSERGPSLPYDWVDTYWVGPAPESALTVEGLLQLRWSALATYGGRPVLLSAVSDWRDAVASPVVLMLARPADRTPEQIRQACSSPAAKVAESLGFSVEISHAGVVLAAAPVSAEALAADHVHQLLASAYGLAGTGLASQAASR